MLGLPFPPARRDPLFVFYYSAVNGCLRRSLLSLPIYWLCSAAGGEFGCGDEERKQLPEVGGLKNTLLTVPDNY